MISGVHTPDKVGFLLAGRRREEVRRVRRGRGARCPYESTPQSDGSTRCRASRRFLEEGKKKTTKREKIAEAEGLLTKEAEREETWRAEVAMPRQKKIKDSVDDA